MQSISRSRAILLLSMALLTVSCATPAPAPQPKPPPVPAGVTKLQLWDQNRPDGTGQTVLARNLSSDTILIYSLTLYDCVNIQQACGTTTPNVRVAPGETITLLAVNGKVRSHPHGSINTAMRHGH